MEILQFSLEPGSLSLYFYIAYQYSQDPNREKYKTKVFCNRMFIYNRNEIKITAHIRNIRHIYRNRKTCITK